MSTETAKMHNLSVVISYLFTCLKAIAITLKSQEICTFLELSNIKISITYCTVKI